MWGFIKLWGKVGLRYPIEYIDAFLLNTQGYWWLDDTTHAKMYGEGLDERQGYLLTDTKQGFGIQHQSLLKPLETLYEKLFSANEYQRIPILSLLFAPSLYIWLLLFAFIYGYGENARQTVVVSGLMLCYVLTLLLGPCVLIRYVYPVIVSLPLMLFSPSAQDCRA